MFYEFELVVTDADGYRVRHPIVCRGSQIVGKARSVLYALEAIRIEVWLDADHLYTFGETQPSVDYELAA